MKKLNLKITPGEEAGNVMIGIASHENDYKLVWSINSFLKLKFVRIQNLIVENSANGDPVEFSRYVFDDEERYIRFNLVSNRCADGILFPEIRNIDFIVHVAGDLIGNVAGEFLKSLKKLDVVTGAYIIDSSRLKGADRLLLN